MGWGVYHSELRGVFPRSSGFVADNEIAQLYEQSALIFKTSPTQQTLEKYWQDAKLDPSILENQLKQNVCYKEEKNFLSCVNALLSVAHQFDLHLSEKGFIALPSGTLDKSEMQLLRPWTLKFESLQKSKKLNFLELWAELKTKIPQEKLAHMVATALNGLYSVKLDPHSYLLPLNYYQNVLAKADQQSQSLGIILTKKSGRILVRKVLPGSLADKSGIIKGDQIQEINGISISVDRKNQINDLLKPREDRPTRITLLRDKKVIRVQIRREPTEVRTVTTRFYPERNASMVTLNKFAKESCQLLEKELASIEKAKIKSVILDLRDNAGGQIDEAACMVGLFVGPKKKVFELKYFDRTMTNEVYASRKKRVYSGSLAVLVNSGSASSSEILAGALQDFGRAVIIGETTFGKGTFQEGEVWERNSRVVFFQTKGLFYLPSGRTPQAHGIVPDVEIASVGESRRERDLYYNFYEVEQPEVPVPGKISLAQCKEEILRLNRAQGTKPRQDNDLIDLELQTAQNTLSCLTQRVSSLEARTN